MTGKRKAEGSGRLTDVQVDRRKAAFDSIVIDHPRMDTIERRIRALMRDTNAVIARNKARSEAANGRSIKPEELWVLPIVGPSGATKSKSIEKFVDKLLTDPDLPENDQPILIVTVQNSSRSARLLQAQILEAFGEPSAETVRRSRGEYSEASVNADIRRIAERRRTSVVVLDEMHSMLANGGDAMATTMATCIKSIVNGAVFSVVLAGTKEIRPIFKHKELKSRNKEPIELGAFDIDVREDREYFFGFAAFLEKEMRDKKVIDQPIGLVDSVESRALIFDMAAGVIGTVSRVMRLAIERAFDDGRGHVTWDDIGSAFQAWNNVEEEPGYDPFGLSGPKKATLAACKRDAEKAA